MAGGPTGLRGAGSDPEREAVSTGSEAVQVACVPQTDGCFRPRDVRTAMPDRQGRPSDPGHPVALVTGGGTGIGLAIARGLAEDGYDLVLASRSAEHLADGARELAPTGRRVLLVPTDVRDPGQVDLLVQRIRADYRRLDTLINNAAGNFVAPAEKITPNGWAAVVRIVLDGTFLCSRACFPLLKASPSPSIVNIVAAYAWMAGPGTAHSAAAKAGVLALSRTLAVEWAPYGIRVNAVAPGPIRTRGTNERLWVSDEVVRRIEAGVPMRRFGTVEEVADAVRFLVSRRASYITGQVLAVDGGQWLGRGLLELLDPSPGDTTGSAPVPSPPAAEGAASPPSGRPRPPPTSGEAGARRRTTHRGARRGPHRPAP